MRYFDAHMHCFPAKLAGRALENMSKTANTPYHTDGTIENTQMLMQKWSVDKGLFLHIATRPGQMQNVNNFAASLQNEHIFCFGSVHPLDENVDHELERIKALGLHGVKLHFDYQKLMIDDSVMDKIYPRLIELDLPLTIHAGWDPYSPEQVHAPVASIAKIADRYPDLKLICAHLGGMKRYEEVLELLAGRPNLYFDTAMCAKYCPMELFQAITAKHPISQILFGSDCPWDTCENEIAYIKKSGLSMMDQEQVFYDNLARLLKIEDLA